MTQTKLTLEGLVSASRRVLGRADHPLLREVKRTAHEALAAWRAHKERQR